MLLPPKPMPAVLALAQFLSPSPPPGAVLLLLADNLRLRSWLNEYEWRLRLETVAHNEWKAALLTHRRERQPARRYNVFVCFCVQQHDACRMRLTGSCMRRISLCCTTQVLSGT